MNKMITEAFKPLGIPVVFNRYKGSSDVYAVFKIQEINIDNSDDSNESEMGLCYFDFWYRKPEDYTLYQQIKKIIKDNENMNFRNSNDLDSDDFRGKAITFRIRKNII